MSKLYKYKIRLIYILEGLNNKDKVLIFIETKKDCEDLSEFLT